MSVLPAPEPLEHPPGDPEAVFDLVADLTAGAARLDELAAEVGAARGRVPEWQGADADATAARADAVARVAVRAGEALRTAAARLAVHAECWRDVRRRVQSLRAQQEDDFAVARVRVATPMDPTGWTGDGPASAVEELEAAERGRRAAHTALRADLEEDAAVTGRVLAGATAGIDGGAGSASEWRVLASLAAELPHWAAGELTWRGRDLARRFLEGSYAPEDVEELAREAAGFASLPGFGAGFFTETGSDRAALLFEQIGSGRVPPDGAFASLLVHALSTLGRDGAGLVVLRDLLAPSTGSDAAVVGTAAVLALGARRGVPGPPPQVLAGWGRDLLARERTEGERWSVGARPAGMSPATADPLALVLGALVAEGAGGPAVDLLGAPGAWAGLLRRSWDDQGLVLSDLIELAGAVRTAAAGSVLRGALVQLGTGLVDGDPDNWMVNRAVVETVSPALSAGLVTHLSDLTGLLMVGVEGVVPDDAAARALHGLGYVSVEPAAAATIESALRNWRGDQWAGPGAGDLPVALPSVAVPASFIAVREFGQRLVYVIECFERQDRAARRERIWEATVGLASQLSGRRVPLLGQLVSAAETVLQRTAGWDGRYENGPDRGLRFDAASAAADARAHLDSSDEARAEAVAREAAAAFDRTSRVLRAVDPPEPPRSTFIQALVEGMGVPGRVGGRTTRPGE